MRIDLYASREKAGLTQAELAAILGISEKEVSHYKQNLGTIPFELLFRWTQALKIDISTLTTSAILSTLVEAGDPYQ